MCNIKANRILIVANSFHPNVGGVARFQVELCDYLSRVYDDVHVCTLRTQFSPYVEPKYKVHSLLWPKEKVLESNIISSLVNLPLLVVLVLRLRPKVIISANYFPACILTCIPSCIFGVKHIVYPHGSEFINESRSRIRKAILRITEYVTHVIIFNSWLSMEMPREVGVFQSVRLKRVVPPVFNSPHYGKLLSIQSSRQLSSSTFRFLTIGLTAGKGIDLVLFLLRLTQVCKMAGFQNVALLPMEPVNKVIKSRLRKLLSKII